MNGWIGLTIIRAFEKRFIVIKYLDIHHNKWVYAKSVHLSFIIKYKTHHDATYRKKIIKSQICVQSNSHTT